jgi:hypothetical protein
LALRLIDEFADGRRHRSLTQEARLAETPGRRHRGSTRARVDLRSGLSGCLLVLGVCLQHEVAYALL